MVNTALQTAQVYANTVIVAIATLLVGFVLGTLAKKFLSRFLREIEINKIKAIRKSSLDLERGIGTTISYIIYIVTIILFLDQLGIRALVITLIIIGLIALLSITIIIGLRNVPANLKCGLQLKRADQFRPGKSVTLGEIKGIIERVNWLETKIRTERGDLLYVPNSLLNKP